jgi:AAA domain
MGVKIDDDFTGGDGRHRQRKPRASEEAGMGADQYAPAFAPNVTSAIGQIYAGVTPQSAARANLCTVEEITYALTLPDARLIEPTSEWDAVDLLNAEFRETPDILAGVVPVGVTLISAAPKVGKTRLLTQVAVAAVRGSAFLNRVVIPTKVLTLALEDGARRYRKSLHQLVGSTWPGRNELTIRTASLRLNEGGITHIEQHLDKHSECKLVIIDVLARVRPRGHGSDKYQLDYDALAPLQRMANLRQIAIVVVHHANQRAEVSNIFERVSGTSGLTGVVDSLLLLQRRNGDDIGILSVSGREVEDQTIALGFADGWWGPAPEGMPATLLSESREVRLLWLWLAEHDGASTEELAKLYGRTTNTTQKLLHRLEERELVDSLGKAAPGRPQCWQVVRRDS